MRARVTPADCRTVAGWKPVLVALALALASGLLYTNTLRNPFVYDDVRVTQANLVLKGETRLWAIALQDASRPLVSLSYALDHTVWGAEPFGFHLTNVFLHVLNVVLVFAVARRAAADAACRRGDAVGPGLTIAVVSAGLFGVHPLMSGAVGYISSRPDVLGATIFLMTLLAGRRWMVHGGAGWAAVTWAGTLLALATKEVAAALPLLLFLYDRLLLEASGDAPRRRFRRVHVPLLSAVAVLGAARLAVLVLVEYPGDIVMRWRYLAVQLDVVRQYLWMLVLPRNQSIYHGTPLVDGAVAGWLLLDLVVLLALASLAVWAVRTRPLVSLGIAWFLLLLAPSSALYLFGIGAAMAEHRVYLASVGVFLTAGMGVATALQSLAHRRERALVYVILIIMGVHLSARTFVRNDVWRSPEALWREAVARAPLEWLPRAALADVLFEADRCDEAASLYWSAYSRNPEEPMVLAKGGACLLSLGRLNEAERAFAELSQRTAGADGPLGMALVAMARGEDWKVRLHLREAVAREPLNESAKSLLADVESGNASTPLAQDAR